MYYMFVWFMRIIIEVGSNYGGISTGRYDRSISIST